MPTSHEIRLNHALSVTEMTRPQMSLAVITNDKSVKDTFLNRTERVTYDVQLFFKNGTETEYMYNSVKKNKAWNHVNVAYV